MCQPTKFDRTEKAAPRTRGGLSKVAVWSGGIFAFLVVMFPIFMSELIGGWTSKYTSPLNFSPASIPDLAGQVVIVTGSNTGIGYHTALELARKNAHVIVASRSAKKGEGAVAKIQDATDSKTVQFLPLDLSSLASVKSFAKEFQQLKLPLHKLVLNAGIMKSPGAQFVGQNLTYGFDLTEDGFESHIGVNHIGHFYLTQLLRDNLVQSAPSRVVSVSSMAAEGAYQPEGIRFDTWTPKNEQAAVSAGYEDGLAYGQSKLANLLFARELSAQLQEKGVTAYSCHPGVIVSELGRYMELHAEEQAQKDSWFKTFSQQMLGKYFEFAMMKTADGALTQLHLATMDTKTLTNGAFYNPIGRMAGAGGHPQGSSESLQKELWKETERMISKAGF